MEEDWSIYSHSPAHLAVARRDYAALNRIIASLPRLAKAGEVKTEEDSLAAEKEADALSSVIDSRDVPGRETPLHLAVKLRDPNSVEILMSAGANWSLQNGQGWSALQEAVCLKEEKIAIIIARYYQPFAWAKWCRRLPMILATTSRIRDFYMEITFHFESSVIPFIGRVAPSDTYRIWKRGTNLRADMTLAGFDGFRIQRSDQTFLFLGDGYSSKDISLPAGSLVVLSHKGKVIKNAFEGAGIQPTEDEVAHEVSLMSQTNMYRPGIDVTQAELVPLLNWRRQERTEMVGEWKARVYDMLNVMISVKSRRVPGAMTDEELFSQEQAGDVHYCENDLTAEERMQLDSALKGSHFDKLADSEESNGIAKEKKSWFGSTKKNSKNGENHNLLPSGVSKEGSGEVKKGKDKNGKKKKQGTTSESKNESEYKKGLRPVLCLTPDFPLKTEELLPLLDILANKVKAVRRIRELLTTKLPNGMFPVKLSIPLVPTIRVVVTFTKFEELPLLEEFSTPLSSPTHFQDAKSKESETLNSSWISSWVRGSSGQQSIDSESCEEIDPFHIPPDYVWVDSIEKKRRVKSKKGKHKKTDRGAPDE
ncbi:unnamed protein product [Cuscuta epithymum]|uniref:Ankyrin repeat domain-containing protein n=1 Tax=Cuscuta epithymum TaxID=186058 RepID=A0AAV0ENP0_9ASTE|nr:unnamed protein product [Cuscuta epithymum]